MAKLEFTIEQIERKYKLVDEGWWIVKLLGFKPKAASKGDSYNLNPILEIVRSGDGSPAPTKDDGTSIPVYYNLNTKASWIGIDFSHMFGIPHEVIGKIVRPIPGIWIPESEPDLSKCEYKGPLIGKEGRVYLVRNTWDGKERNQAKTFECAVKDCAQRFPTIQHTKDLTKVRTK